VRDINFYKQAGVAPLDVLYTGGSVTGQFPNPALAEEGVAHCLPFYPARGGILDEIGYWLQTAGDPGAKVRVAIYGNTSDTDLSPAELLVDSGDLVADGGAGNYITTLINLLLDRQRLYWICVNATSPGLLPVIGAMNSTFYFNVFGFDRHSFNSKFGIKINMPFAPFPNPFPPITNAELANGTIESGVVHYSS
jgi:hypothetical protein